MVEPSDEQEEEVSLHDDYDEINGAKESEVAQENDYQGTSKSQASSSERRSFQNLWLISYSDFMTILMIFFLAMYGYTALAKAVLIKNQPKQMTYTEFAKEISKLKAPLGEQLEVEENVSKIILQMPESILFASGQATLTQSARTTLAEFASSLKQIEGSIVVEGHTDNLPIRAGKFHSNWELSAERAFSVIAELTKNGIPPERLSAWGFGENRPLVANTTNANRSKNRRIEVVILKKTQPKIEETK